MIFSKERDLKRLDGAPLPYSKIGRVYRRLRHRAVLGHATLEKSILIFWHFSIKLDPLIMNMTLVFGFGASGRRRKHFKVSFIELITPTEPSLAAWVSQNFFPGEGSVGVINSMT